MSAMSKFPAYQPSNVRQPKSTSRTLCHNISSRQPACQVEKCSKPQMGKCICNKGTTKKQSHKTKFWFSPVICNSFIGTVPSQALRRWCMQSGLMVCTAALQTRGQVWGMTKACTLPYCPSTTCILIAILLVLSWHLQQHMQGSDN